MTETEATCSPTITVAPEDTTEMNGWGAAPTGPTRWKGQRQQSDLGDWHTLRGPEKQCKKKITALQSSPAYIYIKNSQKIHLIYTSVAYQAAKSTCGR